jgi:Integrase core domain
LTPLEKRAPLAQPLSQNTLNRLGIPPALTLFVFLCFSYTTEYGWMLFFKTQQDFSPPDKGVLPDTAAMESFFGTLKEECVGSTVYASHEEARSALFSYLEIYYNSIRRHSALGYVSPLVYEQKEKQLIKGNV